MELVGELWAIGLFMYIYSVRIGREKCRYAITRNSVIIIHMTLHVCAWNFAVKPVNRTYKVKMQSHIVRFASLQSFVGFAL